MNRELELSVTEYALKLVEGRTSDMAPTVYEIPVDVYTDPEHGRREAAMFRRLPLLAAMSCQIPRPGDFAAVELLGVPLLLTRDREGQVNAFLNVCRHRGMKLTEGRGTADRVKCPYHAWAYDLNGKLVGVPRGRQGFPELCHDDRGLVPVSVVERHGIVWVRLDGGPIDIDAFLGDFGPELAQWEMDTWHFAENDVKEVRANWKLVTEGYLENYHVEFLHRGSLDNIAKSIGSAHTGFGDHQRLVYPNHAIDALKELPKEQWKPRESGAISFILHLFPGTILGMFHDHFEVFQMTPGSAPNTSISIRNFYTPNPVPDDELPKLREKIQFVRRLLDTEDYVATSRCQETLASGANKTLVFGRQELGLHSLHDACAKRLAGQTL